MQIPNFIVSTSTGLVINVITGAEFHSSVVLHSHTAGVVDLSLHPSDPVVASCAADARVHLTRYDDCTHVLSKQLDTKARPTVSLNPLTDDSVTQVSFPLALPHLPPPPPLHGTAAGPCVQQ